MRKKEDVDSGRRIPGLRERIRLLQRGGRAGHVKRRLDPFQQMELVGEKKRTVGVGRGKGRETRGGRGRSRSEAERKTRLVGPDASKEYSHKGP